MPGAPIGPALRSTRQWLGVTVERRIVDALGQIVERVEHQRRAFVLKKLPGGGRELDGGALRGEAPAQDRDRLVRPDRPVRAGDHLVVGKAGQRAHDLAQGLAAHRRARRGRGGRAGVATVPACRRRRGSLP